MSQIKEKIVWFSYFTNFLSLLFIMLATNSCGQSIVGSQCIEGYSYCGEECVDIISNDQHCGKCFSQCSEPALCQDGECQSCRIGQQYCNGECVEIKYDTQNCGECNNVCPEGWMCLHGYCRDDPCPENWEICFEFCIDIRSDFWNCGECHRTCETGQVCANGECSDRCPDERQECSGFCVDTKSDPFNCGRCNLRCEDGESCYEGECRQCPNTLENCSGSCVDLQNNSQHCSECFFECTAGTHCSNGACIDCRTGVICSGNCVDLSTDPKNCGACFFECDTENGSTCLNGNCTQACELPLKNCDGDCVDLSSDPLNCGGCASECQEGWKCSNGTCVIECEEDLTDCGNHCIDVQLDPLHCGLCDNICESGICDASECQDLEVGHLILMGHNFRSVFPPDQTTLLGNSIFLPMTGSGPSGEVKVLIFTGYSTVGADSPTEKIIREIDYFSHLIGRSWLTHQFYDPAELPSLIGNYDVLLVVEQSLADNNDLISLGNSWFATFNSFLGVGGVVIVLDGGQGNDGTWQILDALNFIDINGFVPISSESVENIRPGSALTRSMSMMYSSGIDSVAYLTSDPNIVIRCEPSNTNCGGATGVVFHMTYWF